MNSLKMRLTLAAVVATVVVVGVCGFMLYRLIKDDLNHQFDLSLLERARAQTALVDFDEDGLQFEWEQAPTLIQAGALPRYWQVRDLNGELVTAAQAWPTDPIESPSTPATLGASSYSDLTVNGLKARAVALRFLPQIDEEAEGEPDTLVLIVAEPLNETNETLERFRMLIGLAGLIGIGFSVLLLRLILWRELKPLDQLAGKIAAVDESSLGSPIEIRRAPTELKPVVTQLNAMLARVDDTLRREQEFTAGAAHELRTPLAGIRAQLELSLSRDRTPEQHREFAAQCLDISLQMQTIVENLLALARSGNGSDSREPVNIRELLRDAFKPFVQRTEQRNVQVEWEFAGPDTFTAQRQSLHLVASNLLENAANYVDDGGRIEIAAESGPDGFTLEVTNTGCTLDPNQVERVFEPFWRADEVRTGGQAHAGLGLAICRRMAKGAGGDIAAQVIKGRFVVTYSLPA